MPALLSVLGACAERVTANSRPRNAKNTYVTRSERFEPILFLTVTISTPSDLMSGSAKRPMRERRHSICLSSRGKQHIDGENRAIASWEFEWRRYNAER